MENDNRDGPEFETVLIPLSLIQALAFALLKALDDWMDERGIEEMEISRSFVAMSAAVNEAMECLSDETEEATLQ